MSIIEVFVCNLLIYFGYCKDITEYLLFTGPEKDKMRSIGDRFVGSLIRDLYDPNGTPNLEMGVIHLPFDKQYSLNVLKKVIEAEYIVRALFRVMAYISNNDGKEIITEKDLYSLEDFRKEGDAKILEMYNVFRPMFIFIKKDFSEDEILEEYHNI